jgi:tetratricopeptide (TPR) repeat protein
MRRMSCSWIAYPVIVVSVPLSLLFAGCSGSLAQVTANVEKSHQAQRSYETGLARYKAADYQAAIPHLRRALELDSTFDDAEAHLAWSYYHEGNYVEATRHFRQALARQPKWEGLHNGLGWSRYRMQRYHLALEAFRQVLAFDPKYRDAAVGYAYTLFELGRYAEALPHLEQLTREGEGSALRSSLADVERVRSRYAWTLFYLGDYPRARAEFLKGVAARPDWAGLHNGLGWTYLRLQDRARAGDSFRRALQLQPGFPDAQEGLALAAR